MAVEWPGDFDMEAAERAIEDGIRLTREPYLRHSAVILDGPSKLRAPLRVMRPLARPVGEKYVTPIPGRFVCLRSPQHEDAIELNPLHVAPRGRPISAAAVAVLIEDEAGHAAGYDEAECNRAAAFAVLKLLDRRLIDLDSAQALLITDADVGLPRKHHELKKPTVPSPPAVGMRSIKTTGLKTTGYSKFTDRLARTPGFTASRRLRTICRSPGPIGGSRREACTRW